MNEHRDRANDRLDDLLRANTPDVSDSAVDAIVLRVSARRSQRRRTQRRLFALASVLILACGLWALARGLHSPEKTPRISELGSQESQEGSPTGTQPAHSGTDRAVIDSPVVDALAAERGLDESVGKLRTRTLDELAPLFDALQGERSRDALSVLLRLGRQDVDRQVANRLHTETEERAESMLESLHRIPLRRTRRLVPLLLEDEKTGQLFLEGLASPWAGSLAQIAIASGFPGHRALAFHELVRRDTTSAARLFYSQAGRLGQDELRVFVTIALRRLDEPRAHAVSEEGEPRRWSDNLLGAISASNTPAAWPFIRRALDTRSDGVTLSAAGNLGDPRALARLRRHLFLVDGRGESAAEALGKLRGDAGIEALAKALRTPEAILSGDLGERVRRALRARGDDASAWFTRSLEGDGATLEYATAFADVFPDAAAAAMVKALFGVGPPARPVVVRVLARLGRARQPEALAGLVLSLKLPDVHRQARESLARIAQRDYGPDPRDWRQWLARPST